MSGLGSRSFHVVMCLALFSLLTTGCARQTAEEGAAAAGGTGQGQVALTAGATAEVTAEKVARGKYLVTVGSCNDCHTPLKMGANGPEPDMSRMLSGHPEQLGPMPAAPALTGPWMLVGAATATAYAGPWGVSYAANLTPDATGMSAWDEATFVRAMRTGKHMGQSRPILPPMPWPWIGQMTDEDLSAVWAYLQTIPPIVNHVPEAELAAPPAAVMPAPGAAQPAAATPDV